MICERCGKEIKITRAIISRTRHADFEYKCKCGYYTTITGKDVEEHTQVRFYRLTERRKHDSGDNGKSGNNGICSISDIGFGSDNSKG